MQGMTRGPANVNETTLAYQVAARDRVLAFLSDK
jgi:hypothetical protein